METLQKIVEEGAAGGMSRLIAYLGVAAIGVLLVAVVAYYVRWRIRRALRRVTHPISSVVGGAKSLSKAVGKGIADKAIPTASTIMVKASDVLVPAMGAAGLAAADAAKAGASVAANVYVATRPIALDAAGRVLESAKAGRALASGQAERLAPVLQAAAESAAGAAKAGASSVAEKAVASLPHVREAAGNAFGSAVVMGTGLFGRVQDRLSNKPDLSSGGVQETKPVENKV